MGSGQNKMPQTLVKGGIRIRLEKSTYFESPTKDTKNREIFSVDADIEMN